jgi:hypothetical protein
MNTINHSTRLILVGVILFFILACNLFTPQPVAPVQVVTIIVPATSDQSLIMPSPSSTFLPSVLPINTSTFTPTFPPTFTLTFTSTFTPTFTPTSTITNTPTNTPLPPLPDFDEVISFGGGGAGGRGWGCNFQKEPNTIKVFTYSGLHGAELCILLQGINLNQPFKLIISQPGKSTRVLSNKFWFDSSNKRIRWGGYSDWSNSYLIINHKAYLDIPISLPTQLFLGKWTITFSQEQFQVVDTFGISKVDEYPHIYALDSKFDSEIIPDDFPHSVRAKSTGKIDVVGMGFPANVPVYVLLYRETSNMPPFKYSLIQKQAVLSDTSGSIFTELISSFVPGQIYNVYGITNPNTPLGGASPEDCSPIKGIPCDIFSIVPSTPNSGLPNSCPGAPPQRMTVNQHGYVCTRSDSVRVRVSPARSATTLVQIEPGTQFTVIGGPSCSDNWSWWNVQLSNGTTGWVSEGGDEVDPYFICPLP